jgi:hypothetical protein
MMAVSPRVVRSAAWALCHLRLLPPLSADQRLRRPLSCLAPGACSRNAQDAFLHPITTLPVPYVPRSMLFYIVYVMAVAINFCGCVWCFVAYVEDFDPSWVNFYSPFVVAYGVAAAARARARARARRWRPARPCWGCRACAIGRGQGHQEGGCTASLHCLPPQPRTPDRPRLVLNPPSRVQPPAANTRLL